MNIEERTFFVRNTIAEVLEVEPERIHGKTHFMLELAADSLRIIEILARVEAALKVTVDQAKLARMVSLDSVCEVIEETLAAA